MKKILLKSEGYTLIELLLYIGIVVVLGVSIFNYYSKKSIEVDVYNYSQDLISIDKQLEGVCASVGCDTALNNAFLINNRIIPDYLVNGSNLQHNIDGGGPLSITNAPGSIPGTTNPVYRLITSDVSQYACVKLATSEFARTTATVMNINTVPILSSTTPFSSQTVANAATNCNLRLNRVQFFKEVSVPLLDPVPSTAPTRPKENALYIPTIGLTSSVSGASGMCAGGSTWNGSFCACPANTHWNGSTCLLLNSTQTWCHQGQGGNTANKTCQTLPSGTSVTANHRSGRHITNASTIAPQKTLGDGNEIPVAGSTIISGKNISWQTGVKEDGFVHTCVNGAWNTTLKRCVTP